MEIGGEEDEKEEKKGAKLVRTANDKQIITFSLAVRCATGKEFIRSNIFLFSLFFFVRYFTRKQMSVEQTNKRAICRGDFEGLSVHLLRVRILFGYTRNAVVQVFVSSDRVTGECRCRAWSGQTERRQFPESRQRFSS